MAQAPSQQDKCAKLAQTFVHSDTCCQKGTMASAKREADELAPRDEQSSKAQHKEEQTIKNNLQTFFRRQVGGHMVRTSPEDKVLINNGKKAYETMNGAQKLESAMAFKANKRTSTFQWMKEYTDSLVTKKNTTITAMEKYMTRSFAI